MNSPELKKAYTVDEFCRLYGIGRTKAYEEIKEGRLSSVKVGKRRLIPAASADVWLESLVVSPVEGGQA